MDNQTIGIIGGNGRMGKWLADFFSKHGYKVIISDIDTPITKNDLVKQSDIIIFSLPISVTSTMIEEVLPDVSAKQMLISINSLNQVQSTEMMLKSDAEVLGLHPMFGPFVKEAKDQVVVFCKARERERTQQIEDLFIKDGAKIKIATAFEHDQMMSVIQALNHFTCVVFAKTLTSLGIDIKDSFSYASPIYRLQMNLVGRILAQDPALYGEIAISDKNKEKTLSTFIDEAEKLSKIICSGDKQEYINFFNVAAEHFGQERFNALEETNKCK